MQKKLTALIVDDEIENINLINIYLKKYYKLIKETFVAQTVDDAVNTYLEHYPDILILDIELGGETNSFHILQRIPNANAEIIFITSHKQYAIEAINSVEPTSYLVKPINPSNFILAIERAVKNIETKKTFDDSDSYSDSDSEINDNYLEFIAIPSTNKIDIIHPEDIVYIEADGRYTIFHLTNGNHKIASRNLGEYEKQLNPKSFFRIHHSYIVNLNMVVNINKSAGNYCELLNSKALPIAKRRQERLHRFLKIK